MYGYFFGSGALITTCTQATSVTDLVTVWMRKPVYIP
jgi:hypothetical protein